MKEFDYEEVKAVVVKTILGFRNSDKATFRATYGEKLRENLSKAGLFDNCTEKDALKLRSMCIEAFTELVNPSL